MVDLALPAVVLTDMVRKREISVVELTEAALGHI